MMMIADNKTEEQQQEVYGNGADISGELPVSTLEPAIKYSTHLALTIVYISIYALLFLFVYIQLWLILHYKHKRRSYQTVFLFLCLVWAALRTALFSFYFEHSSMNAVNNLQPFWYWLFYSCPVVLQFTTLVLLTSFFSQVVIKARHPTDAPRYKKIVRTVCTLSVLMFTVVNLVCGIMAQKYLKDPCPTSLKFVAIRVGINDSLFLAYGFALSYWILALNHIANARALLESKGTTVIRSWCTCSFIVLLYVSRAVYNVVALVMKNSEGQHAVGESWEVTDQADFVDLYIGYNYIAYGVVLLFWEILPTFIVTVFFRVQKPNQAPVTLNEVPRRATDTYKQQPHFFDDPRRYDSEEDLSQYGNLPGQQTGTHAHLPTNRHPVHGHHNNRSGNDNSWRTPREPQYYGT